MNKKRSGGVSLDSNFFKISKKYSTVRRAAGALLVKINQKSSSLKKTIDMFEASTRLLTKAKKEQGTTAVSTCRKSLATFNIGLENMVEINSSNAQQITNGILDMEYRQILQFEKNCTVLFKFTQILIKSTTENGAQARRTFRQAINVWNKRFGSGEEGEIKYRFMKSSGHVLQTRGL